MKVYLDGQVYTISKEQEDRMIADFHAQGIGMYERQPLEGQLLGMGIARWVLARWETAVRKVFGKEPSLAYRPPKGPDGKKLDPVIHLSNMMIKQLREMLEHAELRITTDGAHTATGFQVSFSPAGETGRPLVLNGNVGERENNGAQIPGCGVRELVAEHAALCP